jgi:hypothetical protein
MTNLTQNPELQKVLSSFFDYAGSEYPEQELNYLIQTWLCPAPKTKRSKMDIANMVFFVSSLSRFMTSLNSLKGDEGLLSDFFDIQDVNSILDFLNEDLLQNWLCEGPAEDLNEMQMANGVLTVYQINKLLAKLATDIEKGMVLCA